jgi:hypothetical protein
MRLLFATTLLALASVVLFIATPHLPTFTQGVWAIWLGHLCGLACLPVGAVCFWREVL